MEKLFMKAEDVASDLGIDTKEAGRLIRELCRRIKRKGGYYIPGMVPAAYYEKMKGTGFLSPDGAEGKEYPLTEKRLLDLKEFCAYSGLGRDSAYRFGEKAGITKRNGRKILFDRVLFDEWCDTNRQGDL